MKKVISYIVIFLLLIGSVSLLYKLSDSVLSNQTSNIVNSDNSSSKEKDFSTLETSIKYQINAEDNTNYRFLLFLGGLESELYNDISYVEWELYDNETSGLLSSLKAYDIYVNFTMIENGVTQVVSASDYGYDVLLHYDTYVGLEKEYKILANIYNDNGLFYRSSRVFST